MSPGCLEMRYSPPAWALRGGIFHMGESLESESEEKVTTQNRSHRSSRPVRRKGVMVATLAAALLIVSAALAAEPTVLLGNADPFAVLAGETITNTRATTITGSAGLHPGTATPGC